MNDLHALAEFKALDEGRLQPVDKGVVVTQADRDLLNEIFLLSLRLSGCGERDDEPFLQMLARHRVSTIPADGGEALKLADIVVQLSAIRTVLREAHFALDDSEDQSHLDEPVHAVPFDNVMRLHRALKACERFAPKDASWEGPGPLVTQIIEQLGHRFLAHQSETGAALTREGREPDELMAKLRSALRFAASRSVMSSADEQAILAALAQPVEVGEDGHHG